MIPETILTVLLWTAFAVCIGALAWLALRRMTIVIVRRRELRRRMAEPEPETYGNGGGYPVDRHGARRQP